MVLHSPEERDERAGSASVRELLGSLVICRVGERGMKETRHGERFRVEADTWRVDPDGETTTFEGLVAYWQQGLWKPLNRYQQGEWFAGWLATDDSGGTSMPAYVWRRLSDDENVLCGRLIEELEGAPAS